MAREQELLASCRLRAAVAEGKSSLALKLSCVRDKRGPQLAEGTVEGLHVVRREYHCLFLNSHLTAMAVACLPEASLI